MTTTQEEIRDKINKNRKLVQDGKSQAELEKELGEGVEKVPPDPIKPDVVLEKRDFFGVLDMRTMVDELSKLPDIDEVEKDMDKYDAYEGQVRKLWVIKQSDSDSWNIRMRVIVKEDDNGRINWKVENGKYLVEEKKFFYNPITVQDKEDHYKLLNERESARQDLLMEIAKMKNMASKTITPNDFDDYRAKRPWMEKTTLFQSATQNYYLELFKAYFAATDDDVKRIIFDDIMNYVDVALYKEQVKSPK